MGFLEVIIIVLGVIIFIASFFLPDKRDEKKMTIPEDMIREVIDKEIKKAKFQIEEHLEQTMGAVTDKAERSMERLSNEKIKAIDEFSNTVIDRIYKNHEEAVFLYDMLSNKQVQIKHSMKDLEKTAKEGIRIVEEKIRAAEYGEKDNIDGKEFESGTAEKTNEEFEEAELRKEEPKDTLSGEEYLLENIEKEEKDVRETEVTDHTSKQQGDEKNKILELYRNGKSELEIAKELGLGIGEVKLIIGLFK